MRKLVCYYEGNIFNTKHSADSVDLLLDSFISKVKNVIDDIAPIKVSKKTKITMEKIKSSSEYEKTMQKS